MTKSLPKLHGAVGVRDPLKDALGSVRYSIFFGPSCQNPTTLLRTYTNSQQRRLPFCGAMHAYIRTSMHTHKNQDVSVTATPTRRGRLFGHPRNYSSPHTAPGRAFLNIYHARYVLAYLSGHSSRISPLPTFCSRRNWHSFPGTIPPKKRTII